MEEEWRIIKDFPLYEVSNFGHVRKIGKSAYLSVEKANGNAWFVKLTREGERYSKTLKSLVADAFVPKPANYDPDIFDTPVLCSITTEEVRADRIVWRPRWFAIKFRKELNNLPLYSETAVMNLNTGNTHASILTAALHDGTLMSDIYRSAGEGRPAFPNGYRYEFLFRIEGGFGSVHYFG